MAYGIHLASRIELVRDRYSDDAAGFAQAVRNSFHFVGPGVLTGAITTSAAFCTTLFTDFKGVAEMGLIAAVGIVLCLIAMMSVFPALLRVGAWRASGQARADRRRIHFFEDRWVLPFSRHPRATLLVATVVTVGSGVAITQMRFDYDLMKLQPRGVDSVEWQRRIVEDGGQSIWAGVRVVGSMDEARRVKELLLRQPFVAKVDGIGLLIPDDEAEKLELIRGVKEGIGEALAVATGERVAPSREGATPGLGTQMAFMSTAVQAGAGRAPPAVASELRSLSNAMNRVVMTLAGFDEAVRKQRLSRLDEAYAQWRADTAEQIAAALDTSPLDPADIPDELLRPYVAAGGPLAGRYALEVHPKLPDDSSVEGPLDPVFLPRFIVDLQAVDHGEDEPFVTGVIVQVYRSGDLIKNSYLKAGAYALAAVFVLVWLDFRSVRAAGLCLVPVAVGFAVTFGVMWLVGLSINPANIIVLPLMFGIGVDSGVHILHRARQDPSRRPLGLAGGTGKGITVTSLTTMIGFGAMLTARHRGIASLGFVLTVGIGLTLLACWTVMPAWLEVRGRGGDAARGAPRGRVRAGVDGSEKTP